MVSVDRNESLDDDDDDLDRVSELPSLPGSRKSSEQMRKLSGKFFQLLHFTQVYLHKINMAD